MRGHLRCIARIAHGERVGAVVEQQRHHTRVPVARRIVKRRSSSIVAPLEIVATDSVLTCGDPSSSASTLEHG
jgi:hypothetical protein